MAPSLLVKAAFVRGDYDSSETICVDDKTVRTEFILQNIYSYLLKNICHVEAIPAANSKEERVLIELQEVIDDFRHRYIDSIRKLCTELDLTGKTLSSVIQIVSNEVFSEGISWSRIIALFVFVGEYASLCLAKNLSDNTIDVIYECLFKYVTTNLQLWVEDHGNWEGVRCLKKGDSNQDLSNGTVNSTDTGWAKSFLRTGVRLFGTFAHIANAGGQSFP